MMSVHAASDINNANVLSVQHKISCYKIFLYENKIVLIDRQKKYYPPVVAKPKVGVQLAPIEHVGRNQVSVNYNWDKSQQISPSMHCLQLASSEICDTHFLATVGEKILLDYIDGDIDKPVMLAGVYDQALFSAPLADAELFSGFSFKKNTASITFIESTEKISTSIQADKINFSAQQYSSCVQQLTYDVADSFNVTAENIQLHSNDLSFVVGNNKILAQNNCLNITANGIKLKTGAGSGRIAVLGDGHHCPVQTSNGPHIGGPITSASNNVLINNKGVARLGDLAQCVAAIDKINNGYTNILINTKDVAVCGVSQTSHHGYVMLKKCGVLLE